MRHALVIPLLALAPLHAAESMDFRTGNKAGEPAATPAPPPVKPTEEKPVKAETPPASDTRPAADLVAKSRAFVADEKFLEAYGAAKDAAKADPKDYKAHYYQALALLGLKQFDDAEAVAAKALELAPDDAKAAVTKLADVIKTKRAATGGAAEAEAALAEGLSGKAARLYAAAWAAGRTEPAYAIKAAELYARKLDQPVDAARLLREVAAANRGERPKAESMLKELAPVVRKIAEEKEQLASDRAATGDFAGFHAALNEAEAADPDYGRIYVNRLVILTQPKSGATDLEFQNAVKTAIKKDLIHVDRLCRLDGMNVRLQSPENIEFFNDVMGLKNAAILRRDALYYDRIEGGRYDEIVVDLRKAEASADRDERDDAEKKRKSIASALKRFVVGKLTEARITSSPEKGIELLKRAVLVEPESGEIHAEMAWRLAKTGPAIPLAVAIDAAAKYHAIDTAWLLKLPDLEKWLAAGEVEDAMMRAVGYEEMKRIRASIEERTLSVSPGSSFPISALGLSMVWVQPGTFIEGRIIRFDSMWKSDRKREVTLTNGYWIADSVITLKQWNYVMEQESKSTDRDDYPVCVTWVQAKTFCKRLTEIHRKAGKISSDYQYTLPSVAEWEFAATERQGAENYRGDLLAMGWFKENSNDENHPVRKKKPNALGLYDLYGNTDQWCEDGEEVISDDNPRYGQFTNPILKDGRNGLKQIIGGSYYVDANTCKFFRCPQPASSNDSRFGFRIALSKR